MLRGCHAKLTSASQIAMMHRDDVGMWIVVAIAMMVAFISSSH